MLFDSWIITIVLVLFAILGMDLVFLFFYKEGDKKLTQREFIGLAIITTVVVLLGIFNSSGYGQ